MPRHDHDLGARGRSVPFSRRRPASATCFLSAAVPITNAVRPGLRLGQQVLEAPPTVTTSAARPGRRSPEPRHVVLGGGARVVGGEGHPLCGSRSASSASGRPRVGLVAHPHAAVEIEDELVVSRRRGDEGHVASLRRHAAPLLVSSASALVAAACGDDDSRRARPRPRRSPPASSARCMTSRRPRPARTAARESREPSWPRQGLRPDPRHELRLDRHPSRPADLAAHGRLVAGLARSGFYDGRSSTGSCPAS